MVCQTCGVTKSARWAGETVSLAPRPRCGPVCERGTLSGPGPPLRLIISYAITVIAWWTQAWDGFTYKRAESKRKLIFFIPMDEARHVKLLYISI